MPICFRRFRRIFPGVRLNLSHHGASVTVGQRGVPALASARSA